MPTEALNPALQYVSKNKDRFLQDFRTLLKQPSVSALKLGIEDCAKIVKKQMEMAGLGAETITNKNRKMVVDGEDSEESISNISIIKCHYVLHLAETLRESCR